MHPLGAAQCEPTMIVFQTGRPTSLGGLALFPGTFSCLLEQGAERLAGPPEAGLGRRLREVAAADLQWWVDNGWAGGALL